MPNKFLEIYEEFTYYFLLPTFAQIRIYYYQWGNFPGFILLNLCRLLFSLVQCVTWRLNGVTRRLDEILRSDPSQVDLLANETAHVLQVLASCKPTPFDKVRQCFYLTRHKGFRKPECILADNIMLAEITVEKAIFVEFKNPIDSYTAKNEVFLYVTLVNQAVNLIEMPLNVFHQLANHVSKKYGVNNGWKHVMFLFNSGRCGSTVVARMIEEADPLDSLVLSEPSVFMDFIWFKRQLCNTFFETTLHSTMILFLKPMCGRKRLVVKLPYFVGCIAEEFHATWPWAQCTYLHRSPLRVVLAHERAFGASPICKLLLLTMRFDLWPLAGKIIGFHRYPHVEAVINKELKPTMFEVCLVVWSDSYRRYLEQAEVFPYPALCYDSLLENPTDFCRRLLQLADLPESRLNMAFSALKFDSQEESVLSRRTLQHVPMTPYCPELESRTDRYCDALHLPRLDWGQWKKYSNMRKIQRNKNNVKLFNDNNLILEPKQMYKPVPLQCLVSDCS